LIDCPASIHTLISINEKFFPFGYGLSVRGILPQHMFSPWRPDLAQIDQKSDYGLIVIRFIASRNEEEVVNAKTIAEQFDIPVEHLAKVL